MVLNFGNNVALGTFLVVTLGGCGIVDSGDNDGPGEEAKENVMALINGVNMMGTWSADCHGTDLFDKSVVTKYKFKGDDVEKTYSVYDDDDCEGKSLATISYTGEFELDRIEDKDDYRELDLKYKKVRVKLNNDAAVDFFNSIDFCGEDDWKKGQYIDLTEESSDKGCVLPKVPDEDYELVRIDDDKLYFGNPGVAYASKKSDRPEEVDEEQAYTKED